MAEVGKFFALTLFDKPLVILIQIKLQGPPKALKLISGRDYGITTGQYLIYTPSMTIKRGFD